MLVHFTLFTQRASEPHKNVFFLSNLSMSLIVTAYSLVLFKVVYFDIEIVRRVCDTEAVPFRPYLEYNIRRSAASVDQMVQLIDNCWNEEPAIRPDFSNISAQFRLMTRGK